MQAETTISILLCKVMKKNENENENEIKIPYSDGVAGNEKRNWKFEFCFPLSCGKGKRFTLKEQCHKDLLF